MTDPPIPPRLARLVLVTPDGEIVGALPPFPVASPWWQDAEPVVHAARRRHGIGVILLRMLDTELPVPHGGTVTYLAEIERPVAAEPWAGTLDDHPLRMTWARPGGAAADVAWADSMLAKRGLRRIGPAQQVRSWNLSSLWRLPLEGQAAWLKVVPPFFMHEGGILERLQGERVPTLIAHQGPRLLLAAIPGHDLYHASPSQLREMVSLLVTLQQKWMNGTDELLALGLPDWRAPALTPSIGRLMDRIGPELTAEDRVTLDGFVMGLAGRFERVAACGLPDTLVHGDFSPGNVRGDEGSVVLLDWGDCGVGHPLLDEPAFLERVPLDLADNIRQHWHAAWSRALPGSAPGHASGLLRPVAAARQALIYQKFLDGIEPSERPYHAADPAEWLRRTAELIRLEGV